ncbi:N-acetyl-gamma-glutamyl-phosphate reductase [Magnetospira sp. QH-2]|uniref:N-acetyl-gamma-glutamyl-phosphate reductase n=1 Tax=Magnetospira sp. (strain QH-2) TaxID=1288970 RepID=UPI0003E80CE4|nr:N-acetyl-gamma-glutamyl-phosphate reductase [Magnetospira sp. QH-2]CCQ73711.1 N-acetyl-gamma-glutamyl-phosphate reductase [Magnetospira sp. QH-2]
MTVSQNPLNVAVLGASGYTGAELVRLLSCHDGVRLAALTADRKAGQTMASVFPQFAMLDLPTLITIDEVDWSGIDVVFGCLPHGTMHGLVRKLPERIKVIDLSADFRLRDGAVYKQWYGLDHSALDLQEQAVYGLPEIHREAIAGARIVAGPGCYPTAAQVPLVPLLTAGLIDTDDIIIDAKSGVSGAGRAAKEGVLHTEVSEGFHAYGVAGHRHAPEIEQGLGWASGTNMTIAFTPHLVPMNRGILATMYVKLRNGASADDLRVLLADRYADEPFVTIVPEGHSPSTRHVRGSNHVMVGVFQDRLPGRAIVLSAIDNLVKGASGQLVQSMNVMCGFPETQGLEQLPLFP